MNINERCPSFVVTPAQKAILDLLPSDQWLEPYTINFLTGATGHEISDMAGSGILIRNGTSGLFRKRHSAEYIVASEKV